jgi:hypothetical protein
MAMRVAVGISNDPDSFEAGKRAVEKALENNPISRADLIIVFSSIRYANPQLLKGIRSVTGPVPLVGCTDAGGISREGPNRRGVTVMLMQSDEVEFVTGLATGLGDNATAAGRRLAGELIKNSKTDKPMRVAMMLPDGLRGNGADVVRGMEEGMGAPLPIVGGAAGDDFLFKTTHQYFNDQVLTDSVPGVLFRGNLKIGVGVRHGWKPLGIPRVVTRSKANVVYEIDGRPAVTLYEEYFGTSAADLKKEPLAQMAITYPLGMYMPDQEEYLIRDPITVNDDGSIVCAAEMPQGSQVRLMMGSTESAIAAAKTAAQRALARMEGTPPTGAIIFNCIARDKLLGTRAVDEIRVMHQAFGTGVQIAGFYTYGEQAPVDGKGSSFTCHFHNETVVIFLFG